MASWERDILKYAKLLKLLMIHVKDSVNDLFGDLFNGIFNARNSVLALQHDTEATMAYFTKYFVLLYSVFEEALPFKKFILPEF